MAAAADTSAVTSTLESKKKLLGDLTKQITDNFAEFMAGTSNSANATSTRRALPTTPMTPQAWFSQAGLFTGGKALDACGTDIGSLPKRGLGLC